MPKIADIDSGDNFIVQYVHKTLNEEGFMKKIILLVAITLVLCAICIIATSCDFSNTNHTHTYGDWKAEVEANCESTGLEVRTCAICNERDERIIPALEHELIDHVEEAPATCVERGVREHYTCANCGKFFSPNGDEISVNDLFYSQTGHNLGSLIKGSVATCCQEGTVTHYECLNCGQYFANNKLPIDSITIAKKDHTITMRYDKVEPTCTDCGYEAHGVCSECGLNIDWDGNIIENIQIAKLSHEFGQWHDEIPATCEEDGVRGYKTCSSCKKNYDEDGELIEYIVIAKSGHRRKTIYGYAASCEEDGLITYRECVDCHKLFAKDSETVLSEEDVVIKRLGHNTGNIERGWDATCIHEGQLEHFECSRCGQYFDVDGNKIDTIIIPTTDHNYVENTAEGEAYYFCSMCGQDFDEDKKSV